MVVGYIPFKTHRALTRHIFRTHVLANPDEASSTTGGYDAPTRGEPWVTASAPVVLAMLRTSPDANCADLFGFPKELLSLYLVYPVYIPYSCL